MGKETVCIRTDFEAPAREDRSICIKPRTTNLVPELEDFTSDTGSVSGFTEWEFIRFMANINPRAITRMDCEQIESEAARWFGSSFGIDIRRN